MRKRYLKNANKKCVKKVTRVTESYSDGSKVITYRIPSKKRTKY